MPSLPIASEYRALTRSLLERLAASAPQETGESGSAVDVMTPELDQTAAGYLAAIVDVLMALGAIELDPVSGTARVTSVQGGYFLRMLLALLDVGAPLIGDWTTAGVAVVPAHPFGSAVDLLAALDRRRSELTLDAPPLRQITAAIGLIVQSTPDGKRSFLMNWDEASRCWQAIGGRFETRDGTLRTTMLRELEEELNSMPLVEGRDIVVQELGSPFVEERFSPTYGLRSRVTFQAYTIQFVVAMPPMNAGLRWVSEAELLSGIAADGHPISGAPFQCMLEQIDPASSSPRQPAPEQ